MTETVLVERWQDSTLLTGYSLRNERIPSRNWAVYITVPKALWDEYDACQARILEIETELDKLAQLTNLIGDHQ